MKDSSRVEKWYREVADSWTSEQRKNWYSAVASAYNRTRPRYPKAMISRAVSLAQLPESASILEIGCGPGNATEAFGKLGFRMVCLEPSEPACQLARQNCAQYGNVEIKNTSFEEWELEPEIFDGVLAATAFHWVAPERGYPKVTAALKARGALILLWNTSAQPPYEVYQMLDEVYQIHAPSLGRYEDRKIQLANLNQFVQKVKESGYFQDWNGEDFPCEVTYSIDDYLALLSTYSPYINLESQQRDLLFAGLRETLEKNCGNSIQLSYLSVFQVARNR